MKALMLILCGLMLLSTKGNAMYIYGPFGSKDMQDNKHHEAGLWVAGGEAQDDGIHYTGGDKGLTISPGKNTDTPLPSVDTGKEFALAMTFKAGSLNTTNGTLDLFSSFFRKDDDSLSGLNMGISYDGGKFTSNIFEDTGNRPGQLTGSFVNEDLTIIINQTADNHISITFYAGRTSLGTIDYGSVSASNNAIHDFTLGSSDTSLILKGLGVYVNGTLDEAGLKDYFDKVGAQSVPEPGAAILALWGGVFVLCRRRRAA